MNVYFIGIKNFDYFYFFILINDFLTIFSVFILNKMIVLNVCHLNENNEIMSKTNSIDENKEILVVYITCLGNYYDLKNNETHNGFD